MKGLLRYPPATVSRGDGHRLFSESSSVFASLFELLRDRWRECRRISSLRRLFILRRRPRDVAVHLFRYHGLEMKATARSDRAGRPTTCCGGSGKTLVFPPNLA